MMKRWTTRNGISIIQLLNGRCNVFLLTCQSVTILVDTGTRLQWKKLHRRLQFLNIQQIDYLILTHAHYDHCENAPTVKQYYHPTIITHRDEAVTLCSGRGAIPRGTNGLTRLITDWFGDWYGALKAIRLQCDIQIDAVYDFHSWGLNAYILPTPGHSTGSVSLIVDHEIAIVGDAMFGVFRRSVFPPFAMDPKQLVDSWGLLMNTDCRLFLPGHGKAIAMQKLEDDYNRQHSKYADSIIRIDASH